MSFGGHSNNPPWQKSLGSSQQSNMPQQLPNLQPALNFQNQLFNQILGMGQQNQDQNNTSFSNSSIGNNTNNQMQSVPPLFQQSVSWTGQHGLNPWNNNNSQQSGNKGNNSSGGNVGNHQKSQQNQNNSTYNTIGTVTKIHNDCGFVDDEVFFNKSVCKGGIPKVGDRVLVEAAFNANSPFKWNASRVQIVPSAGPNVQNIQRNQQNIQPLMGTNSNKGGSGYNAVPPPNEYQFGRNQNTRRSPIRRSPDRHPIRRDSRQKDDDELDRKRRREDRDRERERHRDKRDHSIEKRDRSPIRRPSPKRRRAQGAIPRYMVQIPKVSLTMKDADVLDLRRRYNNLYVPSDFFFTQIRWADSFPPNKPFSIQRPCSFHIMNKSVEQPKENNISQNLDAPDADYLFCAKVMLMGTPPITEIYQKCLFDEKDRDDDRDFVHPTRLINFLVGIRGKNETMAIGGPWSPSLDGENPDRDPTVLIKTAIRTCKLLTGIDLSGCTQWYRFVELYYRRAETSHKGRVIPARVETVVIFLPDINSCMPTRIEWDNMLHIYKTNLDQLINKGNSHGSSFSSSSSLINASSSTGVSSSSSSSLAAATSGKDSTLSMNNSSTSSGKGGAGSSSSPDETGNEKDETTVVRREPTHYSDLCDVKTMKIQDLRDELLARNLSSKGVKPQLVARLTKAINAEKLKDNNEKMDDGVEPESEKPVKKELDTKVSEENEQQPVDEPLEIDMTNIVVIDEYDSTKSDKGKITPKKEVKIMDEKERQIMERRYQLPDAPHIIVHPSRTAKSGKFDCSLISLSLLLDYRPEDTKEHSFEVSLFAELFNEMLMRDFGFNIYTELMLLPEKPKEKDEKKKDDKKGNDDKKDDHDKDSNEIKIKKENDDKQRDDDDDREKSRERPSSENDKTEKKSIKDVRDRDRKVSKPRNHEDDTDDDVYSIKSGDRKKKPKLIVSKPNLLLSFIYFDTTHCGYIFEKDVEELLYTLGLSLSRAQVRKVLTNVISRHSLYYRKLTDTPSKSDDNNGTIKENAIENNCESMDIDTLAKGNKAVLPVFKEFSSKHDNNDQKIIKRERLSSTEKHGEEANDNVNSGMVLYNGGLLDIGKLFEQMKRSEKAREETENILTDLRKQNTDLQASNTKANNKIKDLQSDNKSLSRKLGDAEQNISTLNKKSNEYYTALHSIYDKVSPIIGKNERTTSSSSTSKNDSFKEPYYRDKEREKDREIREKEKQELDDSVSVEFH